MSHAEARRREGACPHAPYREGRAPPGGFSPPLCSLWLEPQTNTDAPRLRLRHSESRRALAKPVRVRPWLIKMSTCQTASGLAHCCRHQTTLNPKPRSFAASRADPFFRRTSVASNWRRIGYVERSLSNAFARSPSGRPRMS